MVCEYWRAMMYVNYGCGFTAGEGWLNFDSSPTLRFERIPVVGKLYTKNQRRFPNQVIYGDITKRLLCNENEADGIFASHVLEHMPYDDCLVALRNTYAMLKPSGIFRLVVPDLEIRARRYVDDLHKRDPRANEDFLTACHLGVRARPHGAMQWVAHLFGGSAHLWMWDEPSMTETLRSAGFVRIRRCRFGDCEDSMFARVEEKGRFSAPDGDELAIECRK